MRPRKVTPKQMRIMFDCARRLGFDDAHEWLRDKAQAHSGRRSVSRLTYYQATLIIDELKGSLGEATRRTQVGKILLLAKQVFPEETEARLAGFIDRMFHGWRKLADLTVPMKSDLIEALKAIVERTDGRGLEDREGSGPSAPGVAAERLSVGAGGPAARSARGPEGPPGA